MNSIGLGQCNSLQLFTLRQRHEHGQQYKAEDHTVLWWPVVWNPLGSQRYYAIEQIWQEGQTAKVQGQSLHCGEPGWMESPEPRVEALLIPDLPILPFNRTSQIADSFPYNQNVSSTRCVPASLGAPRPRLIVCTIPLRVTECPREATIQDRPTCSCHENRDRRNVQPVSVGLCGCVWASASACGSLCARESVLRVGPIPTSCNVTTMEAQLRTFVVRTVVDAAEASYYHHGRALPRTMFEHAAS